MPILQSQTELCSLLHSSTSIAVVGLSEKPWRDSNSVTRYLLDHKYTIYPVNPMVRSVFGIPSFPSLEDILDKVDIVDIFRTPTAGESIVLSAAAIRAHAVWFQFHTSTEDAVARGIESGLDVIVEKCIMVEHRRCAPVHIR